MSCEYEAGENYGEAMSHTILVLDDDSFMRKLMEVLLVRDGYTVLQASDTNEALEHLSYGEVDLITCDIMMPDIDGFVFLEQLKAEEEYQNIPVIVVTAAGLQNAIAKANELGACCVVEKPFTTDTIRAALTKALNELQS
jgi:CheY-like chemotaxis protein